jgi:alpha-1,6-mannosyltransferase
MRIVKLANFVTPTSGGLRRTLEALGPRYVAAGHRCTLIHPGPTRRSSVVHGVRVEQIPGPTLPMSGGYRVLTRRTPLQRVLDAARPDVVELSDKTTLSWVPAWLQRRGVPTVLIAHDRHDAMLAGTLPDWLPWRAVIGSLATRASDASAAVVCASDFCAEQFGTDVDIARVPLGVDLRTFHPGRAPAPLAVGGEAIPLVFVGRLSTEKRPAAAIDATRELVARGRNVTLRVIGDGPLRGQLEAHAIGLPVRFVGHLDDRRSVATIVAGARVMLAPCGTETFGLAVLEALACGTPVVVPPDGGAKELLAPGTGEVVPPTPTAIADAVDRLLADPRAELTRRCRSHAERFSWDATARIMLGVLARVSATSATQAPVA